MPQKLSLELYKKLYLVRRCEEAICERYKDNGMKTPVHLSLGAEAISVGVTHALRSKDSVFGTYRSHAIYLSRTLETDKFFAELYGKKTGLARGKAGSMHLSAPQAGFLGTSAIVAGHIPIGVGVAHAHKTFNNGRIVAIFFGDGATDEGVFWESLNAACLMRLPVLFVCEDNDLAVFTHKSLRHGYRSLKDIVAGFNCDVVSMATTDVEEIYHVAKDAVKTLMSTRRPYFLHLKYYRYLEHVGVCQDFHCGYRSKEEFEKWHRVDPIKGQRQRLVDADFPLRAIKKLEACIDAQVKKSIKKAEEADFPGDEELFKDVYA